MRVFISWSGTTSREIAEILREWLPTVIQAVKPWMSTKDIDKGRRWSSEIAIVLSEVGTGILCVTRENLESPWLIFEAGALSKAVDTSFVCPYLYEIHPTDLRGPLSQFQAAMANEEDTLRLLWTINKALGESALPEKTLRKAFELCWPSLKEELSSITPPLEPGLPQRTDRELIEETLSLIRSLAWEKTDPTFQAPLQFFRQEDQVPARQEMIISVSEMTSDRIGANEPCPCGSGKKFKKCHGRREFWSDSTKEPKDIA